MDKEKENKPSELKTSKIAVIDLIVKILSTVIIAIFGLMLNHQATKITNSLKANEILQKLIEDLSTPENVNHYRKDLAFIVLQEIYDDDSLILKISKCIYENDTNPVNVKNSREYLSKKDPEYLKQNIIIKDDNDDDLKMLDSIPNLITPQKKDTINQTNQSATKLQEKTKDLSLKLTKSFRKVAIIYTEDGKIEDKIKKDLVDNGFDVLCRKKPEKSPNSEIIYVYDCDEQNAKTIKNIIVKKLSNVKVTKSTKYSKIINKNQILIYL